MEELNNELKLKLYVTMRRIRALEAKVIELFMGGEIPGFLHSSIGEEASAAGCVLALKDEDYLLTTHRGHGHVLAKGADMKLMMAELFGRETGYCRGRGGSMHIMSAANGILGANGIVGAGIPISTGAALKSKLKKTGQVTMCFFGDGASNTGAFHEGINLASIWDLPVIFVCENNLYAESTPQSYSMKIKNVSERAKGYGIPGITLDGNDVEQVYIGAREAVERARKGEGPTLLENRTYRWYGHYVGDPAPYRSEDEVKAWKEKDPIKLYEEKLLSEGILDKGSLTRIEEEIKAEVENSVDFARKSPMPDPAKATEYIYA